MKTFNNAKAQFFELCTLELTEDIHVILAVFKSIWLLLYGVFVDFVECFGVYGGFFGLFGYVIIAGWSVKKELT